MNPIRIRIATAADALRITTLINTAFRVVEQFFVDEDRITEQGVLQHLASGEFLLVEDGEDLLGCVYLEHRGERSYLGLLSVSPTRQQGGVGSLMVSAAEDHCRSRGARFMDISVVNLRTELLPFYKKREYVETGTSPFPPEVKLKCPCHFINMSKVL